MNVSGSKKKEALPPVIKVAVVDDHHLFRAGIVSLLKDYEELKVVIQASDGRDLAQRLKRNIPHVVLLDIEMPGMNGAETTAYLKKNFPSIKILVLTMHNEDSFIFDLISRGANGFLPKDKTVDELVDAIYTVMETGKYHNEKIAHALLEGSKEKARSNPAASLTEKEYAVLKLICQQKTNREIAEIMGIGMRTIETHRTAALNKTGAKNTAGLVVYALRNRLIPDLNPL